MITIERCRSHEVHNNPQAWEMVEQHVEPQQAARRLAEIISPRSASGDQYQVRDSDGQAWPAADFLHAWI